MPRFLFCAVLAAACGREALPPERVAHRAVTLAPNVTEMAYAAGAGDRIVGTDDFSDYPSEVAKKPKVGGMQPSLERIVALRPDLVIGITAGGHPNLRPALAAAHIPLLLIRTDRLADVVPSIGRVGAALDGARTAEAMVGVRDGLEHQRRTRGHKPRVLYAVWTSPLYVGGRQTFVDDIVNLCGATNAVDVKGWQQYSIETLVADPPDIFLYPDHSVTKEAVAQLPLPPATRVVAVQEDLFSRPGPRVVQAAAALNEILDERSAAGSAAGAPAAGRHADASLRRRAAGAPAGWQPALRRTLR